MTFDTYTIRLVCKDDLQRYFQLVETNRARLEDFFAGIVAKTKTLEDTTVFFSELLTKLEHKTYLPFLVIDTTTDKIACFIDVKNIDWNVPKAELGCFVDKHYAGEGISTKALLLINDYLFNELGFNKLFLRIHPDNIASRKLAEKCGFDIEGHIKQDYKTTKGEIVDLIYYGQVRNTA